MAAWHATEPPRAPERGFAVLVAHGDADVVVPPANAQALAARGPARAWSCSPAAAMRSWRRSPAGWPGS